MVGLAPAKTESWRPATRLGWRSPPRRPAVAMPIYPAQAQFLTSTATFRGFVGGRGAGKSLIGSYDLLRRSTAGRHYMVVSPTIPVMKDTVWPAFKALCEKLGRTYKLRETDFRGAFRPNHGSGWSTISFRSADDPESLRGPNLAGIWLDEASLMVREVWLVVVGSLRSEGKQGWLSATFTPKGKRHWTHGVFTDPTMDVKLIRAKTTDNPFLPATFATTMAKAYTSQRARQEIDGEFLDDDGAVVQWEHLLACGHGECLWRGGFPATPTGELYMGVDIGRSRDLTVLWTLERVGDILWTREVKVLSQSDFAVQREEISRRLRTGRYVRAQIDQGAIGRQLAEEVAQAFPRLAVGMQLTPGLQGKLADQMGVAFEQRAIRIPDDATIREDFALVDRPSLANGQSVIRTQRDAELGHADRFWSCALALDAALWAPKPVASRRPIFGWRA